jgi:hypothetical protein
MEIPLKVFCRKKNQFTVGPSVNIRFYVAHNCACFGDESSLFATHPYVCEFCVKANKKPRDFDRTRGTT